MLSATKDAISIKLATTVGHFFYVTLTLTLQTSIWLVHLVFLASHVISEKELSSKRHVDDQIFIEKDPTTSSFSKGWFFTIISIFFSSRQII